MPPPRPLLTSVGLSGRARCVPCLIPAPLEMSLAPPALTPGRWAAQPCGTVPGWGRRLPRTRSPPCQPGRGLPLPAGAQGQPQPPCWAAGRRAQICAGHCHPHMPPGPAPTVAWLAPCLSSTADTEAVTWALVLQRGFGCHQCPGKALVATAQVQTCWLCWGLMTSMAGLVLHTWCGEVLTGTSWLPAAARGCCGVAGG